MKWLNTAVALSVLLVPICLSAQFQNAPSVPGVSDNARVATGPQKVSLTGKVISEAGSVPSEKGDVVLKCGNEERGRARIDSQGAFSLWVTLTRNTSRAASSPASNSASDGIQSWAECELFAEVHGYRSESVRLFGNPDSIVQVGSIIVHPIQAEQGFSVSVVSLAAPDKAKKEFEKGQEQAKKGKWSAACDYFRRAIQEYPRYALAWLELGRAQAQQNSFLEAQQSFHQAVVQDSHLIEGYVELARIALAQKHWKDLADSTGHIVEMFPNASPQYWFLNAAANFNLEDKQKAETSAARGLQLDSKHSIPQLEYLYGLTLAARHEYKSAAEHVDAYLRLSPKAADAEQARAKLTQIQKLANSTETSAAEPTTTQ